MSVQNIKEMFCKRILENEQVKESGNSQITETKSKAACLSEIEAGISQYMSQRVGFAGVIKQRFSDFNVHEIDMDGNIVRLTSINIPVCKTVEAEVPNVDVLDDKTKEELIKLMAGELEHVKIDVTALDKDKRKEIHQSIKAKYGQDVSSNTKDEDNMKFIVVVKATSGKQDIRWPANMEKCLHFVLFKSNLDTHDALGILASKLFKKVSHFTYAGTKDKRGNTTQSVCIKYMEAKKLAAVNKSLRNMKVGNFTYRNETLRLGKLKGNHFEIVLRNVEASEEVIDAALTELKEKGFINYYGLQRFGNSAVVPTFHVGKALIKGDFQAAVELLLKPRNDGARPDVMQARDVWTQTTDAKRAFKILRARDRTTEGKVLSGLAKHGKKAYVNALDCLPRNISLLFPHAYQSYIWNKVVSKRIEVLGHQVIEGDLVFVGQEKEGQLELDEDEEDEMGDGETKDRGTVKVVTGEELGGYTITDIVHPLPGHSVTYPNNVVRQWYEELLKEDGIEFDKPKHNVRKYLPSGAYRHIVKNARDLKWRTITHSEPLEDLIPSDMERLDLPEGKEVVEVKEGKYKALVLEFSLDSCTYATMLLREVLKVDTSRSSQILLSVKRNVDQADDANELKKAKVEN